MLLLLLHSSRLRRVSWPERDGMVDIFVELSRYNFYFHILLKGSVLHVSHYGSYQPPSDRVCAEDQRS